MNADQNASSLGVGLTVVNFGSERFAGEERNVGGKLQQRPRHDLSRSFRWPSWRIGRCRWAAHQGTASR